MGAIRTTFPSLPMLHEEYRGTQYAVPRDEVLEPEDYGVQLQETLGHFGSYLWSFVAGGRQCCSMRDRNRKEDMEAARRAAITGRPPPRGRRGAQRSCCFDARRIVEGSDTNIELLKHPKVQASLRVAGEKALNDPGVQSALLTAAKESGDEVLAIVRNQVTSWAQDPQAQARAKEIARQAAVGAGQALGQAGQMLADQIAQGPAGLRFLAFAAAGTSLAVCVLEFLSVESVFTGPARWVISGFQGIFAVTTMLFEMPADWVAMVPGVTHYQDVYH
ncbi:mas [Symbiodinium sp. CCMP2592]|nr:mas [Symbiodinium sp. CCMP2592]